VAVAALIAKGLNCQEIALRLALTPDIIGDHVPGICRRFSLRLGPASCPRRWHSPTLA